MAINRSTWFDSIPEEFGEGPLVFTYSWKIRKQDHDKMMQYGIGRVGAWGMDTQRAHPLEHLYSRTRSWFAPDADGETEMWWFMDEYDSAEAFRHMQRLVVERFTGDHAQEQDARHFDLESIMIPGSAQGPTLFSENAEVRIEFEPYKIRAAALARAEAAQSDTAGE